MLIISVLTDLTRVEKWRTNEQQKWKAWNRHDIFDDEFGLKVFIYNAIIHLNWPFCNPIDITDSCPAKSDVFLKVFGSIVDHIQNFT